MIEGPQDQKVIIIGLPAGIVPYYRVRITISDSRACEITVSKEDFQKLLDAGMWSKT